MHSVARRHLEQIAINRDGAVLVISSNLTGQFWDGSLNYYPDDSEIAEKLYQTYVAKEMYVGCSDGVWADETHAIVGTDEGQVYIFELEDGFFINPVEVTQHQSYVTSVSVTSDHQKVISGGADHCINIGDVSEKSLISKYRAHLGLVNQIVTHNSKPDVFASCSMDGYVLLWDLRNSRPARRIDVAAAGSTATALCLYDNKLSVGTECGEVLIKDLRGGSSHPVKSVSNHKRAIRRIKQCPHRSQYLATCGEDGRVCVINYDLLNTQTIYTDDSHTDFVTGIMWKPDSEQFYTCSWDSTIKLHTLAQTSQDIQQNGH